MAKNSKVIDFRIGRIRIRITLNFEKIIIKNFKYFFPLLDLIIPKDKNLIVFKSIPDYSDNALAYYKYLLKNHSEEYKLKWISVFDELDNKPNVHYFYTFKAIYYLLRANYIVSTHADELFNCINLKRHIMINLWHGMPLKTLGLNETEINKDLLNNYIKLGNNSYMFATSDLFKCMLNLCFYQDFYKTYITGQPRTDMIWNEENSEKIKELFQLDKYNKVVLYMPTYKENPNNRIKQVNTKYSNIFYFNDYDNEIFTKYLEDSKILFIMKPHPFDENFYKENFNTLPKSNNFKILFNDDLLNNEIYSYEIFKFIDLMISDFSSVTLDYLILNRPVIYLNNLTQEYSNNRGLLLPDNTEFLMPGSKVGNFKELIDSINMNLYEDNLKSERERIIPLIHKFTDNKASQRIYEIMRDLK